METTTNNVNLTKNTAAEVQMVPAELNYELATQRAIRNALKIMEGEHGGGFYVQYLKDMGTCYGWLNLIIVYPSGEYKSILLFMNCFKETDMDSGNGVYINTGKKVKTGYRMFNFWEGPDILNNFEELTEYEDPQMRIPSLALWKIIVENLEKVPIVKINHSATLEQLVDELRAYAAEKAQEYGSGFMDDNEKCFIEKEDFNRIVEESGWITSRAKTEIELQGLFVRDTNSKGYQKTKRVKGELKRFYVLRKTSPKNPSATSTQSLNYAFNPGYRLKSEIEIERLSKELGEMTDKYNKLIAENNLGKDFEV